MDNTVVYGGFWKRLLALLIDGLFIAPVFIPLQWFDKTTWKNPALMIILVCFSVLFRPFFEYLFSATPGKMIMKMKVVKRDLSRIGLMNAVLRHSLIIVTGIISLYFTLRVFHLPEFQSAITMKEYTRLARNSGHTIIQTVVSMSIYTAEIIFLLADKKKRSLHDRIGQTLVIEKR
ncbi:MAG: RDD family protein [Bacteroidetes bacterium]|nr:RDD family protein [Bacteroidota bacterium]